MHVIPRSPLPRVQEARARWTTSIGMLCLTLTLLSLSLGVRAVQAGEEASPVRAPIDPVRVESPDPAPASPGSPVEPPAERAEAGAGTVAAAPTQAEGRVVPASDVEGARQPGVAGIEVAPGVIVLNTRGFNYGPPPTELDPAALRAEDF